MVFDSKGKYVDLFTTKQEGETEAKKCSIQKTQNERTNISKTKTK